MTPLSMMTPRMTHVALHVESVPDCVDFYRRYCAMAVCHERRHGAKHIVWMAEPGRATDFIFVIMNGGTRQLLPPGDYRHLGFAVAVRAEVERLAAQAAAEGCLLWPPRDEPFPVGYYCGVMDPAGNQVEFSYGQPLGPGAEADPCS